MIFGKGQLVLSKIMFAQYLENLWTTITNTDNTKLQSDSKSSKNTYIHIQYRTSNIKK